MNLEMAHLVILLVMFAYLHSYIISLRAFNRRTLLIISSPFFDAIGLVAHQRRRRATGILISFPRKEKSSGAQGRTLLELTSIFFSSR